MSLEDAGLYSQVPLLLELPTPRAPLPDTTVDGIAGAVGPNPEPLHVALYILELTNTAVQNGHGSAVIDTAVYSIRWGLKLAGLASHVDHPIVTSAEGGWRDPFS